LVTILYRTAKMMEIEFPDYVNKSFIDQDEISEYARDAVLSLSVVEIVNGNENGEFLPYNNATRAEASKILDSFLKFIE